MRMYLAVMIGVYCHCAKLSRSVRFCVAVVLDPREFLHANLT